LDGCIRLRYQKVSGQTEELQEMSLEELKELNSKLMLITAGTEGKKDVERFSRYWCFMIACTCIATF
jgi:hypothetical protein